MRTAARGARPLRRGRARDPRRRRPAPATRRGPEGARRARRLRVLDEQGRPAHGSGAPAGGGPPGRPGTSTRSTAGAERRAHDDLRYEPVAVAAWTRPVLGLGQSRRWARSVPDHRRATDAASRVHVQHPRRTGARWRCCRVTGERSSRARISDTASTRTDVGRAIADLAGRPGGCAGRGRGRGRTRGGGVRSHFLEGQVRHRRARPFVYSLEHGVTYLALDLDELDGIEGASSGDPPQPAGHPRDPRLGPPRSSGRGSSIGGQRPPPVRRRGPTGWRVTLVTNLRVLGYVFNPASLLPLSRPRWRACESSSSRSTTRTANGTCIRFDRGRVARRSSRRWTRSSTCRPSSRRAAGTPFACETKRHACGSRSTRREPEGLLLHASLDLVRRPLTDPIGAEVARFATHW